MRAFLDDVAEFERRRITCRPIPARWAAMAARTDLLWRRFEFDAGQTGHVPREPGIFCFFVGPPPSSLPPVGFPLYFGRTDRTLRRRFAEYLQEQHDPTSLPQARNFLEVFEGELFFMCTPLTGTPNEMATTVRDVREALQPAFSDSEYEAEAQLGQGAW